MKVNHNASPSNQFATLKPAFMYRPFLKFDTFIFYNIQAKFKFGFVAISV